MIRTSLNLGFFFLLLLVFAVLFAFTPLGGVGGGALVAKSFTEPLRLLRALALEIAPANLVAIAFVGSVLIDSFSLGRRAPQFATSLFEQTTMVVLSGVLCGQYLKISGLASTIANSSTAAILGAFGLAGIGFAAIFAIKVQRYIALRRQILHRIAADRRDSRHEQYAAQRSPWPARLTVGVLTVALLALAATRFPSGVASSETESAGTKPETKTTDAEQHKRPTAPESKAVRIAQETVERITVGAQAKPGNGTAEQSGEASLPSGLRFSWASGGQGYEPAFVKRARDGAYYWRGQRLPPNSPMLGAFALDGPAVRPDGEYALLFFHRDVLASLHGALAGHVTPTARPSIAVDRDGNDVVLRITNAGRQPQTIIVSPGKL